MASETAQLYARIENQEITTPQEANVALLELLTAFNKSQKLWAENKETGSLTELVNNAIGYEDIKKNMGPIISLLPIELLSEDVKNNSAYKPYTTTDGAVLTADYETLLSLNSSNERIEWVQTQAREAELVWLEVEARDGDGKVIPRHDENFTFQPEPL